MRIAGYEPSSTVDGPGLRFVLFVQGCPHHCPGCQNPQTWDLSGGKEMSVQEVCQQIIGKLTPLHQGITFSGGEPFDQQLQLYKLSCMLKGYHGDLDIASYTGYILNQPADMLLAGMSDYIIDGPFIQEQKDISLKWRGSSNQRIWHKVDGIWRVEE